MALLQTCWRIGEEEQQQGIDDHGIKRDSARQRRSNTSTRTSPMRSASGWADTVGAGKNVEEEAWAPSLGQRAGSSWDRATRG